MNIVTRFQDTITGQFFGHTHRDEYRVYYGLEQDNTPVGFSFISPSVTSYSQTNPAYRTYRVDASSYAVRDYDTHYFNLTESNESNFLPKWNVLYTARSAFSNFDISQFDSRSFDRILHALENDNDLFEEYYRRYYVSSEVDIAKVWDLTRRELILRDHRVRNPFKTAPSNLIPVA